MSQSIGNMDAQQRCKYLLKQAVEHQQVWILTDEHGCVMLNSEDEDCVPVWPSKELAEQWAQGDWQECKPESLSLKRWQSHWTPGLTEDELAVAVFPDAEGDAVILWPEEFEDELRVIQRS